MLSLGIDPGTAIVGYGLVREHNDGTLVAVEYGVIRTPSKKPMPERLAMIYDNLTEIIQEHQPDRAGVDEDRFVRADPDRLLDPFESRIRAGVIRDDDLER